MNRLYTPLLVALLLAACSTPENETAAVSEHHPQASAQTQILRAVMLPAHTITSGVVSSDHRVAISSRIAGYIREITAREGDYVKKGSLLVRVDPVDARQALNQALADFADAKADLERYRTLLAEKAISQQRFDKARLRFKVAKSRVEQAKNQLAYAEIASPVTGIVIKKAKNAGDMAAPGAPILIIEDPAQLLVETDVSARAVANLNMGDAVDVVIPALDARRTGHIRQLVNAADPVTHQFHVKIALDDTADVHPGMFAEVRFRIGQRRALLIPAAAVVRRAGLDGVYVVDDKDILHYRQIRLGETQGETVEVVAGLHEGERIAWGDGLATGKRLQALAQTP